MKTFHTFKDVQSFEQFIKTKYLKACGHTSGCLDYVSVGGIVYTMHEYDDVGRLVSWANKKHNLMIEMETDNRYKFGYSDAKISQFEPYYMRNDINYAQ